MKAYKITPSQDARFDSIYIPAKDGIQAVLDEVSASLEAQVDDPDKEWTDRGVKVECVSLTTAEWDEICSQTKEWTS
jgi:hypothetical protein